MEPYTSIVPADFEVGPDDSGSYRYRIAGLLSQHRYHNAASARFDAARPQRVTGDGFLVPDSVWNPGVN